MLTRRTVIIGAGAVTAGILGGWAAWPGSDPRYAAIGAENRRSLSAWPEDVRLRTLEIVRYATLAANSHNTQPWLFEADAESLHIRPDLARRCPVVDPEDRHVVASLGCATENLVLAAAAAGWHADVQLQPAARRVSTTFSRQQPRQSSAYIAIPKRQTTRTVFDPTPLSLDELHALEAAATVPGVRARFLTARTDLHRLKAFVIAGNTTQCQDPAFVVELRDWIRFNQSHAANTTDGLYSGSTGNPALPRWLGRAIFSHVFTADTENPKYEAQIDGSAGAVVLYAEQDRPESWFNVGRASQRFQLEATARDVRSSFINQPVEVAHVRNDFARWLGDGLRPALVLRFGRGELMPPSLRRPVAHVLRWT
ncbi:MAG: nitroreductase family protein [Pseudomonadota bacterium]